MESELVPMKSATGNKSRHQKGRHHPMANRDNLKANESTVSTLFSSMDLNDDPDHQQLEHQYDHHHCLICYSPNLHLERGITPCNHDSICASCHLRLRSLLDDKRCPICKATNEQLIIDADPNPSLDEHKSFDQYEKWGDNLGPSYTFRDDVGMFFPLSYYRTRVIPLFSLACNVAQCQFTNGESTARKHDQTAAGPELTPGSLKDLKQHLATKHHPPLQICDLCVEHKRDFVSRLPRFTAQQMKEHNRHGDFGKSTSSHNVKGHPMCDFCAPRRFYDLTDLHQHLHRDHYECFVCKKLDKPLQFFRDYSKLNIHFDREHFLCHFPDCLAARFVVFANDIDLKAHERDIHGLGFSHGNGRSTKIQMEFRVRGSDRYENGPTNLQQPPNMAEDFAYGLNGEVFVPPSLDDVTENGRQENEPEISHGPHLLRTQLLREQARLRREALGIVGSTGSTENEAFPSLTGSSSTTGSNIVGWIREGGAAAAVRGRNRTELNEENFPSLGGPSEMRTTKAPSKPRINQLAPSTATCNSAISRPFAHAAASAPTSLQYSSSSLSTASRGPINSRSNLSAENFPSLGDTYTLSENKYAAANSYAKQTSKQKNGSKLSFEQQFPAPSVSKTNILQKKAPVAAAIDNILNYPQLSAANSGHIDGAAQIDAMKLIMGQANYKELKKLTKEFAQGGIDPESYVSSTVALFDQGIKDPSFWDFIPNLISSIPNLSHMKRAQRYMESLKYSQNITKSCPDEVQKTHSTANVAWSSVTDSRTRDTSVLIGNSSHLTQTNGKPSWISSACTRFPDTAENSSQDNRTSSKTGKDDTLDQRKVKQNESKSNQGGGKGEKKIKKGTKSELQNLAFGRI